MKQKIIAFFVTAIMFFSLSACHSDSDEPVHEEYSNTVFIYMPWTAFEHSSAQGLTDAFRKNLKDIENSIKNGKSNSRARTIVFFADNAEEGRLFEINDKGEEEPIKEFDDGAMTTTSELTSLLNYVHSISPSPMSILIGSHGSGWLPSGSLPDESRAFGGQTEGLQTNIETLAEAITSSSVKKMRYICFDDCYMANIETAYALRNATIWLIASTSEVMAEGIPYSDVWQYMSAAEPEYSKIVTGFGDFYSSHEYYPYGALSAIDCTKAGDMAQLMKSFNKEYYSVDGNDVSKIQALDGYKNHVFFDMEDYLMYVCGNDSDNNKQIFDKLKELVPYKTCTPYLYTVYQGHYTFHVRTFSGITISDPSTNDYAIRAKKRTEWWKATH